MKVALKLSSALVAVAMTGAGGNAAWAQQAAGTTDAASHSDDIVVTATRRSEVANKIPLAIQAMGGKQLEQLNVTNFDKLVDYLPNVRSASTGPGVTTIYIRGLSSDQAGIQIAGVAGTQPNVGLYLNDLPASTPGRNLDIHATDLERVEVLAGPQGTLFGASSMGGAIRYITNKPQLNVFHAGFTGSASTTKHGSGSYSGEGFVNIPVVKDKLALRVVLYNDYQGGYINNVSGSYQMPYIPGGPGVLPSGNPLLVEQAIQSCWNVVNCTTYGASPTSPYTPPTRQTAYNSNAVRPHFNDATYAGGRVEALWQMSPDWSLEAMGMHQTLKTEGVFSYDPSAGELNSVNFSIPSLRDTIDAAALTLKGRLGILDVIYSASYLDHHSVQQDDYVRYNNVGAYIAYYQCDKGVYYSGYANSYRNGNTCYAPSSVYKVDDDNRRFTTEFRVTTPADRRLRGTFGLFYDHNQLNDLTNWQYAEAAAGFNTPVTPNSANNVLGTGVLPPTSAFVNVIRRTDQQMAAYGEVAFDIVPSKLTLTLGGRYYSDKASLEGESNSSFNLGGNGSVRSACIAAPGTGTSAANPAQCIYDLSGVGHLSVSSNLKTALAGLSPKTFTGFIPKINLNYKISDRSLIYATYSQGYRPGGFNRRGCAGNGVTKFGAAICDSNKVYSPDNAYNYELGAKLNFANQLQINLAAYIINWKNIQMTVFDENISNQTFINNLGNGRIHGIEGDITYRPATMRGLTLNAGFSYNDTKFLGSTATPIAQLLSSQGVLMPAGTPLALSPKFQGNLRARYEWETAGGLRPFVSAGLHHVGSSISSDVANTNILYAGCGGVSPYPTCSGGSTTPSIVNGVTVVKGAVVAPVPVSFPLPGYNTFEASFGFAKDEWSLTFYGENLGDERPQIFIDGSGGQHRITTSRPRTIGMRVSFKM